ncbi:hypothetical protein NDU88_000138 [Pleurodeles waltl]|uniref:Uncharacterized protein n=1 Tax=Pleurodeles waltl TaxID=8319 RepID=A0AAV7SW59_PLEWA|nr:hypothetical protein NDU88_000138 [Pleurodeles waltl]
MVVTFKLPVGEQSLRLPSPPLRVTSVRASGGLYWPMLGVLSFAPSFRPPLNAVGGRAVCEQSWLLDPQLYRCCAVTEQNESEGLVGPMPPDRSATQIKLLRLWPAMLQVSRRSAVQKEPKGLGGLVGPMNGGRAASAAWERLNEAGGRPTIKPPGCSAAQIQLLRL